MFPPVELWGAAASLGRSGFASTDGENVRARCRSCAGTEGCGVGARCRAPRRGRPQNWPPLLAPRGEPAPGPEGASGHEGRAGGAGLCQEPQRADCEGTPSAQRAQGKRGDALARSGDRARVGDSFLSGDVRERNSRTARSR